VNRADIKLIAQIVFSGALLAACLWIILSGNYSGDCTKWAFGIAGVVIGHWLK